MNQAQAERAAPQPLTHHRGRMTLRTGTKTETYGDGYERVRYVPRPGQGGPTMAESTRQLLAVAERELLAGRAELLEVVDALTELSTSPHWSQHRELQRARRRALERVGLAGRLLVDLSRGAQGDAPGEMSAGLDLAPATVAAIATEAQVGRAVYCPLERGRHRELVADLAARLALRGLELRELGPGWHEVIARDMKPANVRCAACAGACRNGRCVRCGTRAP